MIKNLVRNISPIEQAFTLFNTLETRSNINLTGIYKSLCIEHGKGSSYKSFHNKLRKPELTQLLCLLTEQATKEWLLELLKVLKSEREYKIKAQLRKWCRYFSKFPCRAHPDRGEQTLFAPQTEKALLIMDNPLYLKGYSSLRTNL